MGFFEWAKVIQALHLSPTTKLVALSLGLYADTKTGANARPGNERLMQDTNLKETAVRTAKKRLLELGLLQVVRRGYSAGRSGGSGSAADYQLTFNPRVSELVSFTMHNGTKRQAAPNHQRLDAHESTAKLGRISPNDQRLDAIDPRLDANDPRRGVNDPRADAAYLSNTSPTTSQLVTSPKSPEVTHLLGAVDNSKERLLTGDEEAAEKERQGRLLRALPNYSRNYSEHAA
jgi:hypothetical protein